MSFCTLTSFEAIFEDWGCWVCDESDGGTSDNGSGDDIVLWSCILGCSLFTICWSLFCFVIILRSPYIFYIYRYFLIRYWSSLFVQEANLADINLIVLFSKLSIFLFICFCCSCFSAILPYKTCNRDVNWVILSCNWAFWSGLTLVTSCDWSCCCENIDNLRLLGVDYLYSLSCYMIWVFLANSR